MNYAAYIKRKLLELKKNEDTTEIIFPPESNHVLKERLELEEKKRKRSSQYVSMSAIYGD